jgi:hypothetical protein
MVKQAIWVTRAYFLASLQAITEREDASPLPKLASLGNGRKLDKINSLRIIAGLGNEYGLSGGSTGDEIV